MAQDPTDSPVRLDRFTNAGFSRGASRRKELLWLAVSGLLVATWVPGTGWRVRLLRAFGARIGRNVQLKPRLQVRYPWRLVVGDHVWMGERVWIDNFDVVEIASHCCVSQGAYFSTSGHDTADPTFSFQMAPIRLGPACWVGPEARLGPGTRMGEGAVLSMGAVADGILEAFTIYGGNPAAALRARRLDGGAAQSAG